MDFELNFWSDYDTFKEDFVSMWPAMTRVWEKSHDVSFNKQVALEDAHRAVLAETAKSAHPGNVACRDHCLFKELFFCRFDNF